MIEKNKNYAKEGKMIVVEGEEYPLLKTTEKMAFYMYKDTIKRIKISKVDEIV